MADKTILFLQADQLMRKALKEEAKGEFDRALEFMNTSIEILENANLDAFQFKAQRELLYFVKSQSKDISGLISVYENAL